MKTLKALGLSALIAVLGGSYLGIQQIVKAQATVNTTSLTNALSAPLPAVGANGAITAVGPNNTFVVGSTSNILAGYEIYMDQEAMLVTSVPVSGTVTVQRAYDGTSAASHAAGQVIYIGTVSGTPGSPFQFVDPPLGSCTFTNEVFSFRVNVTSGRVWQCATNGWHPYGGTIGNGLSQMYTSQTAGTTVVTLNPGSAGSVVEFNSATGNNFKLPPPVAGMTFDFYVNTTVTSNAAEIQTDGAATFIRGSVDMITATPTFATFACNGTSHVAIKMAGTTTGGLTGTYLRLVAISNTVWQITSNLLVGSGTLATPCSTTT